ncbi:helix-turn-helix domain-containing protein [Streptantibioticus rubrisoli]|uniref:XRE family transcriptional regulator n=1 Tax=Streptantibioticus rubrisoli TaxID=1387313 RepID=A0ABT1PCC1_9ACTN|nr:XRE family transcriptional regulator [Streptantibioticus rubrisoli]MCQ4042997.1 XRE family transcriptional regulator [Streptantibioticus rubrisoli]
MSRLGDAITTARRALGITQEELAAAAGVTQGALSRYEQGTREPDGDVVARLAHALGVTEPFLKGAGSVRGAMAVDAHMRKRATAKATTWRQLEARLNMYRMHVRHLMEEVSLRAQQRVPTFDPIETDPADAARMVRMQWRMPIGPVQAITTWMESAGCIVLAEDFGTSRVDGLSQWVDDYPVVLINQAVPVDRLRLTLGHELGHLCLHSSEVTLTMEEDATRFAAEFLMPEEVIRPQLRNLTLGRLHDLKREWGTSMQALIERAYDLNVISAAKRTNLYKSLSNKGWRTREPLSDELAPEVPVLAQSIGEAMADKGLTPEEIASIAGFSNPSKNTIFAAPKRRLRVI